MVLDWQEQLDIALNRHEEWQSAGHEDRCKLEQGFWFGAAKLLPESCSDLEALMRYEILESAPPWIRRQCANHAQYSTTDILFYVLRELFPSEDLSRLDVADELYAAPAKMPTTLMGVAEWIETVLNGASAIDTLFNAEYNQLLVSMQMRQNVTLIKLESFLKAVLIR
eukprot:6404145-Amphidinium_carterae.3